MQCESIALKDKIGLNVFKFQITTALSCAFFIVKSLLYKVGTLMYFFETILLVTATVEEVVR